MQSNSATDKKEKQLLITTNLMMEALDGTKNPSGNGQSTEVVGAISIT